MVAKPGAADWLAPREDFLQVQAQPKQQQYRLRKWGRSEEFATWLDEGALPSLSMKQALFLYSASGGARRQEFNSNTIEEVRESLDFLLYDTVKLEGRFQECAADGGAYKLAGTGKEFVSYLLCIRNPALLAVWNSNAERAFRKLQVPTELTRKGPLGVAYMDLLEAASSMCRRLGLADFRALDEFSYSVTRPVRRGGD